MCAMQFGTLRKDITGFKFDRLTVVSRETYVKGERQKWLCLCECGKEVKTTRNSLSSGDIKSCGCLKLERNREQLVTHGLSQTPEFKIWVGIKKRCSNPRDKAYQNYGQRGISVCEEWVNSFEKFLSDMGRRPTPEHSIDRIDNNAGYCSSNCKWSTRQEQARNRRSNVTVIYNGEAMLASDLAERLNLSRSTVWNRLSKGWSVDEITNTPPRPMAAKGVKYPQRRK